MRSVPWHATLLLLLAVPAAPVTAQDPADVDIAVPPVGVVQELVARDGSTLIGRVVDAGDPVRFELTSGAVVELARDQILRVTVVEGEVRSGELWRPDPSTNRLFFGPTGRTIDQGEGYFAVFELFFPALGVGVTDRFSIAGGTLLYSTESRPFWVIPKLQLIDQETLDFSIGALAITTLENDFGSVGILFGVVTTGTEDAAFTAGAGWGWVDDDLADTPAILLGGEARVSRNVKLMTENYWVPAGDGNDTFILSAGPRFLGERLSADIALAFSPDAETFFPLVNFVWNW